MRSFGKYFDDQRDRIVKAMKNKNTQQNIEWRERYDRERNKNKPFWYKIEDSLFTEEDDKRIKEYEKNSLRYFCGTYKR